MIDEIIGFPRHLSQHVGGFVITEGRLDELCPVENAAMEDRTVICWDKDDIDALGILKVDILALGMLTCIRKAFELIASHHGTRYSLATLPAEDPAVYDMLCKADSLGVFQVESRAQMSFLPRMRPRTFYDLVIEVAIVRPGPIQGDMVHPYLRRRRGEEKVEFPSDALGAVLGKTLGVPLFQEQAMQIAIIGAGFTPEEADRLRRALATFKKTGTIHTFRERFLAGMAKNGYPAEFAERCFSQIEGFGEYGFPESHAASFALLVYASAWIKRHHPAVFACALLNSQPMGFYAPAQIVRDAREHGVEVRPVCVNASFWDNALEPDGRGGLALRLGFRQIKALREDDADWIAAARGNGYADVESLWRRAGVGPRALAALAEADAFAGARSRPAHGAVAGAGDPGDRAPAAVRRARGRGRRGAGAAAGDDAGRGDRGRLHRAAADAAGASDGADPAFVGPSAIRGGQAADPARKKRCTTHAQSMHNPYACFGVPAAARRRRFSTCAARSDRSRRMSDRPPLLFLHGAFAGPDGLDPLRRALVRPARPPRRWCRDLPGPTDRPARLRDYVRTAREAAAALGERPVAIGHSLGGLVAQHLAAEGRLAGAALIASPGPMGLGPTLWRLAACAPEVLAALMAHPGRRRRAARDGGGAGRAVHRGHARGLDRGGRRRRSCAGKPGGAPRRR